jgi:signal transduction histidine kinase
MATLGSSAVDVGTVGAAAGALAPTAPERTTSERTAGHAPGQTARGAAGLAPGLPGGALRFLDRLDGRLADRLTTAADDGAFSPLARRLGLLYVAIMVPLVTAVSAFATGREAYIFAFVLMASGPFTTPALLVTWTGLHRAPPAERPWYRYWFAGLVLTYMTGVGLLVGLFTGWDAGNVVNRPLVVVIATLFILTTISVVRSRSGRRAVSVDALEGAIAVVVVIAPCVLLWGESLLAAEESWYAIPAALALVALVWGMHWSFVLYLRRGSGSGVLERCGLVLTMAGAANAAMQVAQGISGFTLPTPLPILLHAVCMAMLLLVPLNMPRMNDAGLGRLPPQAQVRGGAFVALLTLAGVPVLLAVTAVVDARHSWAMPFSLGTVALMLGLAALRHLATVRETRRLYARVEQASEERRELLAQVMQRSDDDRHRVAAQLHEQAVSAYASFVSFIQACGVPGAGAGGGAGATAAATLTGASTMVRDDLARHADSLRQLMLTIKPLETAGPGSRTLEAPVRAYLDSLYGDGRVPDLTFSMQDGLVLDWISETIAMRIVQEAVRNVWRHSGAGEVDVAFTMVDGAVQVRVADDGVGFDPHGLLFESGIGAMRGFAAVTGGEVEVASARGAGTTVTARLGGSRAGGGDELEATAAAEDRGAHDRGATESRPKLRLVRGWSGR